MFLRDSWTKLRIKDRNSRERTARPRRRICHCCKGAKVCSEDSTLSKSKYDFIHLPFDHGVTRVPVVINSARARTVALDVQRQTETHRCCMQKRISVEARRRLCCECLGNPSLSRYHESRLHIWNCRFGRFDDALRGNTVHGKESENRPKIHAQRPPPPADETITQQSHCLYPLLQHHTRRTRAGSPQVRENGSSSWRFQVPGRRLSTSDSGVDMSVSPHSRALPTLQVAPARQPQQPPRHPDAYAEDDPNLYRGEIDGLMEKQSYRVRKGLPHRFCSFRSNRYTALADDVNASRCCERERDLEIKHSTSTLCMSCERVGATLAILLRGRCSRDLSAARYREIRRMKLSREGRGWLQVGFRPGSSYFLDSLDVRVARRVSLRTLVP